MSIVCPAAQRASRRTPNGLGAKPELRCKGLPAGGGKIRRVPADLSWSLQPLPMLGAAAAGGAYVSRWRRAREGRGGRGRAPVWRLCCFFGALLLLLGALISPLDTLAEQLFLMHMVQHVLLLDLVPILAIASLTKAIMRPATRRLQALERRMGALARPAFAVVAYVGVIWAWHLPALYDLALRHSGVHVLEHLSFLAVGSLYWWHLLSPIRPRVGLRGMAPVVYMASTKLLVGALGMGLAFAPSALYAFYEHRARVWGISAVTDQALAGLIMAVEQSIVMGVALAALFIRALGESEREQQRRERYEPV
jgi:putative membrane protein